MIKLLQSCENMIVIVVLSCFLVFFAMVIDLIVGVYKARIRGELRTSKALRRTINKFLTYEGGLIIAACVDILIHISSVLKAINLDFLYDFPIVTACVAIFLLIVECLSVKEKASKKTKAKMDETALILSNLINNEEIKKAIESVITKGINDSKTNNEKHHLEEDSCC